MTAVRGGSELSVAGPRAATNLNAPAETYRDLSSREQPLSAAELDLLATTLFWLDRPQESAEAHRAAYAARIADGSAADLALAACWVFWDHALVGEKAVAAG